MSESQVYKNFGRLLKAHRKRLGMTQSELSRKMGLSRASIANMECGRQKVLLHQLYPLANHLEVSIQTLMPEIQNEGDVRGLKGKIPKNVSKETRDWVKSVVKRGQHGSEENQRHTTST